MMTVDSEDDSGIVESGDIQQSNYGSVQGACTSTKGGLRHMSRDKKIIVALLFSSRLLFGSYTMFMVPFFPEVAEKKGLSGAATGFVLSCWDLFVALFAPLAGAFYVKLGPKVLFCGGLILAAISNLVFPLVEYSPPGAPYVAACVVIRMFGGLSGAAYKTSAYATLAKIFPENVAAMFGILELFTSIGFMIGPPLGGGLYQAGGFFLPFLVMGGFLGAIGILSIFFLPKLTASEAEHHEKGDPPIRRLLCQPIVMITGFLVVVIGFSTTFDDLSMAIHLYNVFHLSPSSIGFVSIIYSTMNFILYTPWGILADRLPKKNYHLAGFAFLVMGLALILNGPAPFLHLRQELWLLIVAQCIFGAFLGVQVILFRTLVTAARNVGHEEDDSSEGLVGSVFTSLFSCGAFFGPFIGGAFLDAVGFAWASTIFGGINLFGSMLLMIYIVVPKRSSSYQPVDLTQEDSQRLVNDEH